MPPSLFCICSPAHGAYPEGQLIYPEKFIERKTDFSFPSRYQLQIASWQYVGGEHIHFCVSVMGLHLPWICTGPVHITMVSVHSHVHRSRVWSHPPPLSPLQYLPLSLSGKTFSGALPSCGSCSQFPCTAECPQESSYGCVLQQNLVFPRLIACPFAGPWSPSESSWLFPQRLCHCCTSAS